MTGRPHSIVVGCRGQDGSYLTSLLREMGWAVTGVSRFGIEPADSGGIIPFSLLDRQAVFDLVANLRPQTVYYLAAHHHSSQDAGLRDRELALCSLDLHETGLLHFLDAIRDGGTDSRLLYAASSHVFGQPKEWPQTETTPFAPLTAYAITKAAGLWLCDLYRRDYGVFSSGAILYNHESPRRRPSFLSRKVAQAAVEIAAGLRSRLILGSLDSVIDAGWAPDFVRAMIQILEQDRADDFVVATGEGHTVRDFVVEAFRAAGVDDWDRYVTVDSSVLMRPGLPLIGDARKIRATTGWMPTLTFQEIMDRLVAAEQAIITKAGFHD